MARPYKTGLDYFSHDVDMSNDDKIQLLELAHGLPGYAVMNKLLERIYSNGYHSMFGEREQKLFARNAGIDAATVAAILETCLELEIFDKGMHERYGILTSAGIQKRYFIACNRRERITVERKYVFDSAVEVGLNQGRNIVYVDSNPVSVDENPVNGDGSTQRKVPESIVPETKKKPKKEKLPPRFIEQDEKNAQALLESIRKSDPQYVEKAKPDLVKWAEEFRLIREQDGRSQEDIDRLLRTLHLETFWAKNIRSPKALRGETKSGADKFLTVLDAVRTAGGDYSRGSSLPRGSDLPSVEYDHSGHARRRFGHSDSDGLPRFT